MFRIFCTITFSLSWENIIKQYKADFNVKKIDENFYKTQIIYENEPIKLRKVKVIENDRDFEIGFFDHNSLMTLNKEFFSLINPYPN